VISVIGDENSLNVNFGAGSRRRCRSNLYGASAQLYEAFLFVIVTVYNQHFDEVLL